jgi:NAD+ synthase (glutamine-hydrolysing)
MRIALARFDATVGDIAGNARAIADAAASEAAAGADCVVFPELALCGYPPRDLLQRAGFVAACERALEGMAADLAARGAGGAAVLVGSPVRAPAGSGAPFSNAVSVLRGGRIEGRYLKRLLPDYDVFDEPRHFAPGSAPFVFECAGLRAGVLVCEDLWRAEDAASGGRACSGADPAAESVAAGADVLLCPSASPFAAGKHVRHGEILRTAARRAGVPVCSINASGADDDLVFDGDARVALPDGRVAEGGRWASGAFVVDVPGTEPGEAAPADPMEERWDAIVCGIRGYFRKTGHSRAVLGLSGGIDSALVGALAAAAIGGGNVTGLLMPSRHSSRGSVDDAEELARRTGIRAVDLPVGPAHDALAAHLAPRLAAAGSALAGLADENLQSRLRGVQVMAWSNATGALALTTGNKSEYAVGYATLYGDMCGALAPIGDLLKTDVWALSRWANANHRRCGFGAPPIPEASIGKVPSAELRPDQTDQDTLPPYADLDAIVRGWVEEERTAEDIARSSGLDPAAVARWTRAIDVAEFKRRQAPVILRLSPRAFGPGRRMPVVARDGR